MPTLITTYKPGDAVEVMRAGKLIKATIHKVQAHRIYQVKLDGGGYVSVREGEIERPK